MYCGVTLIECLNILVEAVILIAEGSAISVVQGTSFTKTMYILLAIVSVVVAVLQARASVSVLSCSLCM